MNNRKTTRGRKRITQIIETVAEVPCPIYGHPAGSVPNQGSAYSTHYYTGLPETSIAHTVPYTIRKVIKRRTIIHEVR